MGGTSYFFAMDEQEIYYRRLVVAISLMTDTMWIYFSLKCCETLHYYCYGTHYRWSAHAFCVDVSMCTQPPHNPKWRNVTSNTQTAQHVDALRIRAHELFSTYMMSNGFHRSILPVDTKYTETNSCLLIHVLRPIIPCNIPVKITQKCFQRTWCRMGLTAPLSLWTPSTPKPILA